MSVYMCDPDIYRLIVQAAIDPKYAVGRYGGTALPFYWYVGKKHYSYPDDNHGSDPQWIMDMLEAENRKSCRYRYPHHRGEYVLKRPAYHPVVPFTPQPVAVWAATSCWQYQTCEHPSSKRSCAWQFVKALRERTAAHVFSELPGRDEAYSAWWK